MPKKSSKPMREYTFVKVELSRSEKAAFAATLPPDIPRVFDTLLSLINDGHKVSLSYDEAHKSYIASLTCNGGSRAHNAYGVLTARAASPEAALALLVFKDELLEGHWPFGNNDNGYDFS